MVKTLLFFSCTYGLYSSPTEANIQPGITTGTSWIFKWDWQANVVFEGSLLEDSNI